MRKKKNKNYIPKLHDITPEHDKHLEKFSQKNGGIGKSAKVRELIDRDMRPVEMD